ncbi:MAG TPA: phage holin family protein [Acidimicrobiales bacterium]|nr:phage holin family protein [Acidimicrobiales bacterium]
MKSSSWRRFLRGASLQRDFDELRAIAIRYLKEETIKPIKDLGRFIAWGSLGSIFVGFGSVLLLFASLRYLQWQFPVLDGSLSWLPYLIVAVLALVVIGLTAWRIVSGTAKRRLKASK